MKRIITLALCVVMLFAMAVPANAAGSIYLSVYAGSSSAYRGDSITFTISASGGGSCRTLGFAVSYDSSVFEYMGGSASASGATMASMDGGVLAVLYNGEGTPSGPVASFTLRVRDGAPFGSAYVGGRASGEGASISASGTSVTVYCNHSYGDWQKYNASYHQKTCGICGGTREEEHSWNEGSVVSAPTCKDEGSKIFTCTVCGETKESVLNKTDDHQYGNAQKINEQEHQRTCSVCSNNLVQDHTWDSGTVTKAATCKETGTKLYTCADCSHTKEETIPLSEAHNYGSWNKVDENTHQHICSVCNKEETVSHDWNSGSVTKKPNCIETGSSVYTCKGCGLTKTEELPKTGTHTYDHGCDKDCNVCSQTRSTSHSYSSDWSKNSTEHWHVCTACGEKTDKSTHVPGPEATEESPQLCKVCNYIIKPELTHEHKYSEEWSIDGDGHWYACTGCEEQKDYAVHDFENACDGLCETCGYTRETAHDIGEEWYTDYVNHYQKCVACGHEEEHIRHTPGPEATEMDPQTCEVCGFVLMPAFGHSFHEEWKQSEQTHYHSCDCGEKTDEADHVWDEGVRDSEGTMYTCVVCQYQYFEPLDLSWLIYVAAALVVISGGIIAIVLIRKKK